MPSGTSPTQKKQATKKSAVKVPSQHQQESCYRSESQSTDEWLKTLDYLEAQPQGSSRDVERSMDPDQVKHKQLSSRLLEGMDHEDILSAMERGDL